MDLKRNALLSNTFRSNPFIRDRDSLDSLIFKSERLFSTCTARVQRRDESTRNERCTVMRMRLHEKLTSNELFVSPLSFDTLFRYGLLLRSDYDGVQDVMLYAFIHFVDCSSRPIDRNSTKTCSYGSYSSEVYFSSPVHLLFTTRTCCPQSNLAVSH